MNQVIIFGRLTRDPELKHTQSGKSVASFTLAVNRYGSDEADFFDCDTWEKNAENIANSCKKGHRLLIWGRLRQDKWTDQQTNQNRTAVKITVSGFKFIEPAPGQQQQAGYQQQPGYAPPTGPPQPGHPGYTPPAQQQGYVPPAQYRPPGNPPAQYGQQPPGHQGQQQPAQYQGQPPAQQPPQHQNQQQQAPLNGTWVDPNQIPF